MRLFTAIDLPDGFRREAADLQAPSVLDARWTNPDQFHVTLRFVGDADPERATQYEQAFADVDTAPVRCKPYGLERTVSLTALDEAVSTALDGEGLSPEIGIASLMSRSPGWTMRPWRPSTPISSSSTKAPSPRTGPARYAP